MNKVAHYNGFVGRCQQYGLTKQAADMLYKRAAEGGSTWDNLKGRLSALKDSAITHWNALSPAEKKMLIGGGAGLITGGVAGSLIDPKQRLRNAILGALLGTAAGTGVGYGTDKALALWNARNAESEAK